MDSIICGENKLAKSEKKSADSSTYLYQDSFEINTEKSQGTESVIVAQLQEKLSSLESDPKAAKQTSEEAVAESEVLLIQHKNITRKIQHEKI